MCRNRMRRAVRRAATPSLRGAAERRSNPAYFLVSEPARKSEFLRQLNRTTRRGKSPESRSSPFAQKYSELFRNNTKHAGLNYSLAFSPDERGGSRSSRTRGGMRWTRKLRRDERNSSGRRNRVVPTPQGWRQVRGKQKLLAWRRWQDKPWSPGRARISRKPLAQGRPGVPPLNLYARVRFFTAHFAHETAGAARTRLSLRPLRFRG